MKSAIEAIFARLLSDGTEWRASCTLQGGGLLNPPACLRSPISTYFQDFTLLLVAVRLPHLQVGVNQEFSKIPKSVKGSAASIRPLLGPLAPPGLIPCMPGKGDFQRVIRWKNCSCQPRLLWFRILILGIKARGKCRDECLSGRIRRRTRRGVAICGSMSRDRFRVFDKLS